MRKEWIHHTAELVRTEPFAPVVQARLQKRASGSQEVRALRRQSLNFSEALHLTHLTEPGAAREDLP